LECSTIYRAGLKILTENLTVATASAALTPIQQSLVALRAGQESSARFVVELFNDLEAMQKRLMEVQSELFAERDQLIAERQQLAAQQSAPAERNEVHEAGLQRRIHLHAAPRRGFERDTDGQFDGARVRAASGTEPPTDRRRNTNAFFLNETGLSNCVSD
jgi:hypothetical protein